MQLMRVRRGTEKFVMKMLLEDRFEPAMMGAIIAGRACANEDGWASLGACPWAGPRIVYNRLAQDYGAPTTHPVGLGSR